MWSNTKLLVIASFLVIISGLSFLWFGFKPQPSSPPLPTPIIENTLIATSSASFDSAQDGSLSTGSSAVVGVEGEKVLVTKVVDGDTVELQNSQTVRLIGIDTPETVDPRRPVGCFGKEAASETNRLLSGKIVILQKDISDKDRFGRLLRYVFLPLDGGQTLFVNDYLVRAGFAKVSTFPPDVKFNEQLRQAEIEARQENKGLWGRC